MIADANARAVLTVAEMAEADRLTIAAGTPGEILMEAAGGAVADEVRRRFPQQPVVVLCGPGNNGGDGFVAARRLAEAGWKVRVALLGEADALKGDAALIARRWTGPAIVPLAPQALDGVGIVVDALFGAGLSRPLDGMALETIRSVVARRLPCVGVDVPSGVSGDTGQVLGGKDGAARCVATVTFFRKKPAHLLLPGRQLCGDVVVADIGIKTAVLEKIRPLLHENDPALWLQRFPWPRPDGHKYVRGHALVAGGEMTGAARLAAQAALRVGAGLVTVAAPTETLPMYAGAGAAVIVTATDDRTAFTNLLEDERRNVVLLGPGGGATLEMRMRTLDALGAQKACVLDADALTAFADDPAHLFRAIGRLKTPNVLLTPHEGEFARLFPDIAETEASKLERARDAARRSGAVVLLKGYDTVVAAPDGRAVINSNAPADLATAGAGDVLAGIATGLMAQRLPAFEAASIATWLHGEAATSFGPGLIADDIIDQLPPTLRQLKGWAGFTRT